MRIAGTSQNRTGNVNFNAHLTRLHWTPLPLLTPNLPLLQTHLHGSWVTTTSQMISVHSLSGVAHILGTLSISNECIHLGTEREVSVSIFCLLTSRCYSHFIDAVNLKHEFVVLEWIYQEFRALATTTMYRIKWFPRIRMGRIKQRRNRVIICRNSPRNQSQLKHRRARSHTRTRTYTL